MIYPLTHIVFIMKENNEQTSVSLIQYTQRFLEMLLRSKSKEIDLYDVEKTLGIARRRIYDVINVLSGINLVEKCGKSRVKWIGSSQCQEDLSSRMNNELNELEEFSRYINEEMYRIWTNNQKRDNLWISKLDIRNSCDTTKDSYVITGDESVKVEIVSYETKELSYEFKSNSGNMSIMKFI